MNIAPCAKLMNPSVPKMIVSPLLISASRLPKANPLNACERIVAVEGIRCPFADQLCTKEQRPVRTLTPLACGSRYPSAAA